MMASTSETPATMVRASRAHSLPSFIFRARTICAAASGQGHEDEQEHQDGHAGNIGEEHQRTKEADHAAQQPQQAADEPDPVGHLELGGQPGHVEHAGEAARAA